MSSDSKDRPPPAKRRPTQISTLLYQDIPKNLALSAGERRTLRLFAAALTEKVTQGASFVCLVASDKALKELNRTFRNQDYATDVLSFPSSGTGLGDVAISIERAEEQGKQFGHSRVDELRILMLHGALHLIGMDHEADQGEMAKAEEKWRRTFHLPDTLIERCEEHAR